MFSADQIVVWVRARDARRFQGEMARSAASVREVGAAGAASGKKLGAFGRGMAILTKSLKIGAFAAVAMGAEATSLGLRFDRAMELIHTQSGESQKNVDMLRGAVLNLAHDATQGPVELANALYRLEGAGIKGKNAMVALKASADLAAVGNANVEDTAKTLAQVYFTGIKGLGNFNSTVGELNATVGAGDLRLQQLVDSLGTGIVTSAKQAGLSFQDVTGALAIFGDQTNNVSGWSAQLATALHFLYAPTPKAEKAFKKLGLSGKKMAEDMAGPNGMVHALTDLKGALGALPGGAQGTQAKQLLANILPGGRGRVLLVLLDQLDRYQQKINDIARTNKNFGEAVQKTNEQPLVKLQKAWSGVEADLIRFYDVLKPVVIPVLLVLIKVLDTAVVWLTGFGDHVHAVVGFWNGLPGPIKLAVEALGIFIAQGVALFALVRIFMMVKAAIEFVRITILAVRGAIILLQLGSGPLMLALMALVTVAILIVTHWNWVKNALGNIWNAIKVAAAAVFAAIVWAAKYGLLGPIGLIITHWNSIVTFITKLPGRMASAGKTMWDWMKQAFRDAINFIIGLWNKLHFTLGGWHIGPVKVPKVNIGLQPLPYLATGGTIAPGGMAVVGDAGPELASVGRNGSTTITPLSRAKGGASLGSAMSFHFEIPVVIGGREIARATADQTSDWNARRGR
jgi:TP901 family phage tail tape measure protein